MLFAIYCQDRPGGLDLRMSVRPAHVDYLKSQLPTLVEVGPLLDDDGKPCGSLLIVDVPNKEAAEALAANDPYAKAGLFVQTTVTGYRAVFRGGEALA